MNKEINEVGIKTADIYLHFPCITKDEADELADYLEDENIEYDGATDIVMDLKQRIDKALKKIDAIFNNGDEYTIIDDLLELDKILKGDSNEI